jgi:hypothetical protein
MAFAKGLKTTFFEQPKKQFGASMEAKRKAWAAQAAASPGEKIEARTPLK